MKESPSLTPSQYELMYKQSIEEPETFWGEQADKYISWFKPWEKTLSGNFQTLAIEWFQKGQLNASYNCLDRHLATKGDKIAIIWEGNDPGESKKISYAELHHVVCKFANVLKKQGIKKGDRVCIYLPMIPEALIAMLACARIGAIHSVVFAGFSAEALKTRILDAECNLVITADESLRGDKIIPLKQNVDQAVLACPSVKRVVVVKRTANQISWDNKRDCWYEDEMDKVDANCPAESVDANHPLFILYTSGSTGKPKGILHGTGGYLVYAAMTHHYIFNYKEDDVYWCTADVGWITGHSYLLYGPLVNGATTLVFEGVPHYPTFSRFWEVIDKHQVTIFYTAPTAIRALRKEGDEWVKKTSRKTLRVLGSVGEPINPDVWEWYFRVVGAEKCAVVDTWWQTETGGILLSAIPGATPQVAGSVTGPFFGIQPEIIDEKKQPTAGEKRGQLIIKKPWPGLMQTVYKDKERFIETYFKESPGSYFTGDGAYRDKNGHFWITGRNDDVIKVSGHRIGTEEIENALLTHPQVAEAAVVGIPNEITGEGIYAFVTTKANVKPNDALEGELNQAVRKEIGPIANLEGVQWTPALPKTRSGKIMRRILRKIASKNFDDLGDISTLADPGVIDSIIEGVRS
ncbi:acetyl-CoA synthetase (plasmid) [Legionella adelaidensis]|uniref:Acetyl-coenzyme A synthetase n=1 Tax=Legionella adelaidensis TaxID=45056 RepID=A0A0W0R6E1_9GAMM|nr:acetate--CoA ligase [Legionella adelaidensis]KTC66605.1 acetyl-CoA synthetase [Legionella adelaidensis]VEH85512.1 acetyl-CoA synthetase [Legionella adelaidensis]